MKKAKPLVVINVVGLTHTMLGPATPNISALATEGFSRPLQTVFPAVTCTVQSSLLTGLLPGKHGIVGNGCMTVTFPKCCFGNSPIDSFKVNGYMRQRERLIPRTPPPSCSGGTTCMLMWTILSHQDQHTQPMGENFLIRIVTPLC